MEIVHLMDPVRMFSAPPPGAMNIRLGARIEGPGGAWIPCATAVGSGLYLSGLFEVGPGRRQVCAIDRPTVCVDEALAHAIELALTAAS